MDDNFKQDKVKALAKGTDEHIRALVNAIPDIVFVLDENGRYVDVMADGKEDKLLARKEDIIGKTPYDFFDKSQADSFSALLQNALRENRVHTMQYALELPDGKKYFELRMQAFRPAADPSCAESCQHVVSIIRDITAEYTSEQNAKLLESFFKEATEGILIENEERIAVYVNESMQQLLGLSSEQCLGKHSGYFSRMLSPQVNEAIYSAMQTKGHWHGEVELTLSDQSTKVIWLSLDALNDNSGTMSNVVVMATDISEISRTRQQLEELATHDPLTGLPNRTLMFDRLKHAIASLGRAHQQGAVMFIDLDNFKYVNDEFGHAKGDEVLSEIAECLQNSIRQSDTVARFGGDEFVVLLESIKNTDEVRTIVEKIRDKLAKRFAQYHFTFDLSCSIGIALIPQDGETAEALITAADRAMYGVKRRGKNGFDFYSSENSTPLNEYFKHIDAIKKAISEDAFELLYQPRISIDDGSITGVEALLRSNAAELENMTVREIVSMAEESGYIGELSRVVLEKVCYQLHQWKMLTVKPMKVSVNLSAKEIENETLIEMITTSMAKEDIHSDDIEFEITEQSIRSKNAQAVSNLGTLKEMGFSFALDDYGIGYSSLKELKKFNLHTLKIDKSLIENLELDTDDRVIVKASIAMARQLGLQIVAEGVEREAQVKYLKEYGCKEIQGYYHSVPLKAAAMTELLRVVNA